MLLGAKHLPSWAWGLADGYATYIHDVLPQRTRGSMSPYEIRSGWKPDLELLFIKTFGAPCQYVPPGGAEHKRGKMVGFLASNGRLFLLVPKWITGTIVKS